MEEIISVLQCLKEDKGFYIDDNLIKHYIEENMETLIKEISEEVN